MKSTLQAGLASTVRFAIDRDRTIGFMGEGARVYATPMLVRDIEIACRDLLLQHLEPGEDSVGTRVELDHTAATPLGLTATLNIRVSAVDGRSVSFEYDGSDGIDTICRGRHQRFVVDVKKTEARILAKMQKAAS